MPRQLRRHILGATHGRRALACDRIDLRPQYGRRMTKEEMHVASDRQRVQHLEDGHAAP
jgi:hypothetical protein